ncbi:MAG: winged helix-turn-helix transcriptional regulator [Clostridia bacterium]|nr:winged helix-turn-helix transcriptional regulator [Clostridia bacterium]
MQERFQMFTVLIAKLNRCIRKIKTQEMAEFDLKSPHVSCLYYLYQTDSLTAKELCAICEEDKANISRSIEYLEAGGYLICHSKTEKRYKSPLVLTEKGREVGAKIKEKVDHLLARAGEGLSEENRRIMYQSLEIVCENLQRFCDEYEETK